MCTEPHAVRILGKSSFKHLKLIFTSLLERRVPKGPSDVCGSCEIGQSAFETHLLAPGFVFGARRSTPVLFRARRSTLVFLAPRCDCLRALVFGRVGRMGKRSGREGLPGPMRVHASPPGPNEDPGGVLVPPLMTAAQRPCAGLCAHPLSISRWTRELAQTLCQTRHTRA